MTSWLELATGLISLANIALTILVKRKTASTHGITAGNTDLINELFVMNTQQTDTLQRLINHVSEDTKPGST